MSEPTLVHIKGERLTGKDDPCVRAWLSGPGREGLLAHPRASGAV